MDYRLHVFTYSVKFPDLFSSVPFLSLEKSFPFVGKWEFFSKFWENLKMFERNDIVEIFSKFIVN